MNYKLCVIVAGVPGILFCAILQGITSLPYVSCTREK